MPSSADDLPGKKPPRREGRKDGGTKRKPGKQPVAPGAYLAWNEDPDKTENLFPEGTCESRAAHFQPGRTRPVAREDPAENQRSAPLRGHHPAPLRQPRLRIHRCQARPPDLHCHPRRTRREPVSSAFDCRGCATGGITRSGTAKIRPSQLGSAQPCNPPHRGCTIRAWPHRAPQLPGARRPPRASGAAAQTWPSPSSSRNSEPDERPVCW
jgi:hypothetical protein